VAAGTLVTEGMQVPPRSLVMGSPAKVRRTLTDEEVASILRLRRQLRRLPARLHGSRAGVAPVRGWWTGATSVARPRVVTREPTTFLPCPEPSPRAACATSCPTTSGAARTSSASIRDVYERYGFEPLETPAVENIETLLGKYGEEGNQLIFKILKRGEHEATGQADLALRYDLTVPLARVVAEHRAKLPRFFKRYQIQPVWRADRPARGRFREFYQCDVDASARRRRWSRPSCARRRARRCTRSASPTSRCASTTARCSRALLDRGGAGGAHGDALVALDKLDKIGREGWLPR
jgi:hypothetical protein